jgi:hypothetical protein
MLHYDKTQALPEGARLTRGVYLMRLLSFINRQYIY